MAETEERYYAIMVASLRMLSLPNEEQKKYYPDFVDIIFEILDSYTHAFLLLPFQIEEGRYSFAQIANLLRLNNMIDFFFRSPIYINAQTDEEILTHPDWQKIKEFSLETLVLLNEDIIPPDSKFI